MSAKKWLIAFFATVVGIFLLLAALNFVVDPFGVFGDRVLQWHSYDMTQNPRAAKTEYLKQHFDEYDSYIVGCSSTSSYPTADLNAAFDASFYNLIMYGADMLDVEQTVRWLSENDEIRHLVLNVYIDNAISYDPACDFLTYSCSWYVNGMNPVGYYARYLFADPSWAVEKLKSRAKDEYLPLTFDVFDAETGVYDKRRRDAEPIGDLDSYLQAYPVFADYPQASYGMYQIEPTVQAVQNIVDLCAQKGIDLTVVMAPVYTDYLAHFQQADVLKFYTQLAAVTPFWDFSVSSVSMEPRYFYDATHFRNDVGRMAVAKFTGDDSVWMPEDFGVYVTAENVAAHVAAFPSVRRLSEPELTASVPVLLWHHIDETVTSSSVVTPDKFLEQIQALAEAGYTPVSIDDLQAYVRSGAPLPENPILITFDDGYASNYEIAYPILKQYSMKATIFAIGSSFGKDTYKDTGEPIIPHFDADAAREMVDSGLISIQSHTFDMHQSADYETGEARGTIQPLTGETTAQYIAALQHDAEQQSALISSVTGEPVDAISWPLGESNDVAQAIEREAGIRVSFTTQPGENVIIKGLDQSLLNLHRLTVTQETTVDQLLDYCATARN